MLTLGQGDVGQLGLGEDVIERKRPALVTMPEGIVQAEAGGMHTVCLGKSGKVSMWGNKQVESERNLPDVRIDELVQGSDLPSYCHLSPPLSSLCSRYIHGHQYGPPVARVMTD